MIKQRLHWRLLFLPLLLLLGVGCWAGKSTPHPQFDMTSAEWREVMQARDQLVGAQIQAQRVMERAQQNYESALQKVHSSHHWPGDVQFNGRSIQWEKVASKVGTKEAPKPGPGARPPHAPR